MFSTLIRLATSYLFLTNLVFLFAISLQSVEVTNATFQRIVLIFLSFGIFSWVRNGIGLGLSNLGILLLLLLHHVNLHTINEQPKTRYPTISYSSMKLTISFVLVTLFFAIAALFSIIFTWNIYVLHIRNIWSLFLAFIVLPKYKTKI